MMIGYIDIIYLMHFLFIGPLLIYIGYYKDTIQPQIFNLLLGLGVFIVLYHLYLFCKSMYFKSTIKVV